MTRNMQRHPSLGDSTDPFSQSENITDFKISFLFITALILTENHF